MDIFKTKRVFSLVLTILIFTLVKAQSDFRPGYIITLHGDTINGLIDFRGERANAKVCIFKKGADSEKVKYTADKIISYRFVDGKYYVSCNSINYKFKDLIFLEYVIKGAISIYYYQDDFKDHYFVAKDTMVIELDHHDRLTGNAEEDNLILAKPEKFRAQLEILIQDQPALNGNIDRIDCNTKNLISITKEYQKVSCPDQECILYEKKTVGSVKLKFGMFSSVGLSQLSSHPYDMYVSDYEETKFLDFKPAFTYEMGASINMYLDYIGRNKFCIQLSPALNIGEYSSNEKKVLFPMMYVYKLNIKYTTLNVPLYLKYSFYSSNRTIFPFVKLGSGCAIYLRTKGKYQYYTVPVTGSPTQSTVYNKPLNQVPEMIKIFYVASLGTDIRCGKKLLSVGAAYSHGEDQLKGYHSDIQLQFEFQF
jgi:hypothetical protein